MKIIRAEHYGMCFGVRDAIQMAGEAAKNRSTTVLGQLVHNEKVNQSLRAMGIQLADREEQVATPDVIITAHGASDAKIQRLKAKGLNVLDTTCPLVRFAHQSIQRLVRAGYHPIIVGKKGHVEVDGMTEDLETFDIVLSDEDIENLNSHPKLGIAAQTTQPIAWVKDRVRAIQRRFPESEVRFIDTVCQPTKQRQLAADQLAREADVIVVVGGRNSNNTQMLVQSCGRFGAQVHHVTCADELDAGWFQDYDTVGLTAGTSTPEELVDEVEQALRLLSTTQAHRSLAIEAR